LKGIGVETGPHYWITDRADISTDHWAEKCGILPIRYPNADGKHACLVELLEGLLMYRSVVEPIPGTPIAPDKPVDASDLPGVEELTQHEPEMIRLFLIAHAQKLLASESMSAFAEYEKFLEEYDRAIHFAWYAKPKTGEDVVLGYRLTQLAEQGAFGKVYKDRRCQDTARGGEREHGCTGVFSARNWIDADPSEARHCRHG
jgi:hypothetical protein